ncbi:MAG TPA: HAMP domain-containing sensor histidine kinase, partial [Candidatus Acidoferrales bacterium]|nr:HAMP domain-containing sensor histidine kinase [Candidatus Acidoferrales bacterium]
LAARRRAATYTRATAGALKASVGSVLRKGDLVAAGSGGKWFIALLSARPPGTTVQSSDVDLGVAAERLRLTVQRELARVQEPVAGKATSAQRVRVRCGWNVLEPSENPLEALRHAVRGAALVARIEERRATVLAAVTHELRTPLTAIIGFAERLQAEPAGARRARYLDVIIDESKRLQRLAEGLIDIGAWTAGSLRLNPETHALETVAHAAVQAVAEHAAAKQVKILIKGEATAFIDRDRCLQIFINLLDNAVRYSPEKGRVTVSVNVAGRFCTVEVADQGPGFSAPLRRLAGTAFGAGADGKVGLGLAIASVLVQAHGGVLSVKKSGKGGGMVSVTLPRRQVP